MEDTNDVYFVPCFTGLYTPYWDSTARGIICGLTQCANKNHIARAALQAVAFQTAEMIDAVEHDLDGLTKVHTLRVRLVKFHLSLQILAHPNSRLLQIDGGMTANQLFNQLQANALGRPIVCAKMPEISGWGAAVAAGIGARQISLEQFSEYANPQMVRYAPKNTDDARGAELTRWRDALQRARGWAPVS